MEASLLIFLLVVLLLVLVGALILLALWFVLGIAGIRALIFGARPPCEERPQEPPESSKGPTVESSLAVASSAGTGGQSTRDSLASTRSKGVGSEGPRSSGASASTTRASSASTQRKGVPREEDLAKELAILRAAPLMLRAPAASLVDVAVACTSASCRKGAVLVGEDQEDVGDDHEDSPDCVLLIDSGTAALMQTDTRIATLRKGDCIDVSAPTGMDEFREVQVVAESDMSFLRIPRGVCEEFGFSPGRQSVSLSAVEENPEAAGAETRPSKRLQDLCQEAVAVTEAYAHRGAPAAAQPGRPACVVWAEKLRALCRVEALRCLLLEEKCELATALEEPRQCMKGEVLLHPAQLDAPAFILSSGAVLASGREELVVPEGGPALLLNEHALLSGEGSGGLVSSAQPDTVDVCSELAELLTLDPGRLSKRLMKALRPALIAAQPPATLRRLRLQDFEKVGLLGCGGWGCVELYRNKSSRSVVAVKTVTKGLVAKCGMKASILSEKHALQTSTSPFVVSLHGVENAEWCFRFYIEPLLGGELYATYNKKGFHGSERHARFYVACVTMALEHLHGLGILCRGVKPEDICLDTRGYAKLVDMGISKCIEGGQTYTTCGTMDYFAPEVIAAQGHGFGYDWWALGVLLFELLAGRPPFEASSPMQTYAKIIKGIDKVSFPTACDNAKPLIKALLRGKPKDRLPLLPNGLSRLRAHQWFKDFDWAALEVQILAAPYIPIVASPTDTSNFSVVLEKEMPQAMPEHVPYTDDGSGWDADF